jgi:dihydroorotase
MDRIFWLTNATIVNEGEAFTGSVLCRNGFIEAVNRNDHGPVSPPDPALKAIDLEGKLLIPGVIDDQVHFREPGLTHKADIYTESRAAIAGGITSFMEMPNTVPNTLTQELLEEKYRVAASKSLANFSFYMGASNDNIEEILKTNPENVCGVKVFMGASTGNMLVDNVDALNKIFSKSKLLIAVHCEDETTIRNNLEIFRDKYGDEIPIEAHPLIRSHEACYKSSKLAVSLAKLYNTRLHILHLSTAKEMELFTNDLPLEKKRITSEVCVHHLWFNNQDYEKKGTHIKWNPAIKSRADQEALFNGLMTDKLDVIATDHAPHTFEEKANNYMKAPSGGPLVQHSLQVMMEFYHRGMISLEKIVEKMCHAPATCFQVKDRGFIRPGYHADLVVVDPDSPREVSKENIHYKCGWSPFEGTTFRSSIFQTYVNGNLVFDQGVFHEENKGQRLLFQR